MNLTNEFRTTSAKIKPKFTPTDKALMAKITGRDCTEYHVLNPPVFEEAIIPMKRKGLFWLGAIVISGRGL